MNAIPVIAVFDCGKTNKKIFLFNEQYKVVFEESIRLDESVDEDGFPCENIQKLTGWILDTFTRLMKWKEFVIRAVNFSAYGASLVHLNAAGEGFLPLYNYLKPYPLSLQQEFYGKYGGEENVAIKTASPVLGNLNSGMQLYYLKYMRPEIFKKIKWSLHLPQYLSYLLSQKTYSEITSIGCHTHLWDFENNSYHKWVEEEQVQRLMPPVIHSAEALAGWFTKKTVSVGPGLHDSSAALIPYLENFTDPFILISTGTWCITLNPFNHSPLTIDELRSDCLCYLTYKGKPVKASRIFAGNEHEQQVKRLSEYFNKPGDYYTSVSYSSTLISLLKKDCRFFSQRPLSSFENFEEGYHQLMLDIVAQQTLSAQLVIHTEVKRIFVDGGFSKNELFMNLLAAAFPAMEIYAASVAQASAIGAAIALHKYWNKKQVPRNIIDLKYYPGASFPNT